MPPSGLDIGWRSRKEIAKRTGQEFDVTKSLWNGARYCGIPDMLCEAGRFGRKTGMCGILMGDEGMYMQWLVVLRDLYIPGPLYICEIDHFYVVLKWCTTEVVYHISFMLCVLY